MQLNTRQLAIVVGGIVLAVFFVLVFLRVIPGLRSERGGPTELTVWGVYDTSEVWNPTFRTFAATHENISLTYRQIPFDDYEKELLNAFAAGRQPDILYLHHTWLPKFADKLTAAPLGDTWPTFVSYRDIFVDAAALDFTRDQKEIYGVPLYLDSLALYYNKDLLNAAGIAEPPATWERFADAVERLTLVDVNGDITRAGAAMGTARNINRSTDILGLLMLQTFGDTPMIDREGRQAQFTRSVGGGSGAFSPGVEALRFYTDFANPALTSYAWNREQHYSIDAFVEGRVAMMLNYSHHIPTIRNRAPQLSFGVARAPQPAALFDRQQAIDYANYFGLAVARSDDRRRADAAWDFLVLMMEKTQQEQYQRATDHPPARRDLVAAFRNDPDLGTFAQQSLTARSWEQPDNIAVETIFADMIESVLDGTSVREALARAEGQVTVLMRRAQ